MNTTPNTQRKPSCADCTHHVIMPDSDGVKVLCGLTGYINGISRQIVGDCQSDDVRTKTTPVPDWCPLRN